MREFLDWDEFKERVEAIKHRLRENEITILEARKALARLGFNATDINYVIREVLGDDVE